jgi:hypothetical protein
MDALAGLRRVSRWECGNGAHYRINHRQLFSIWTVGRICLCPDWISVERRTNLWDRQLDGKRKTQPIGRIQN